MLQEYPVHHPQHFQEQWLMLLRRIPILHLRVYPNPVTSEGIWLHFAERYNKAQFKIVAYDLNGRKMAGIVMNVDTLGGDILWKVDHSRCIKGIYVLNVSSGNEV